MGKIIIILAIICIIPSSAVGLSCDEAIMQMIKTSETFDYETLKTYAELRGCNLFVDIVWRRNWSFTADVRITIKDINGKIIAKWFLVYMRDKWGEWNVYGEQPQVSRKTLDDLLEMPVPEKSTEGDIFDRIAPDEPQKPIRLDQIPEIQQPTTGIIIFSLMITCVLLICIIGAKCEKKSLINVKNRKRGNEMVTKQDLEVGELVLIEDYSYALRLGPSGCSHNGYSEPNAQQQFKVLVVDCQMPTYMFMNSWRIADTIIMGQDDNIVWLVHSGLVQRVVKPIKVRFFTGNKDITDDLSEYSKRKIINAQ